MNGPENTMALIAAMFSLLVGAITWIFRSTVSNLERRLNTMDERVGRLSDHSQIFGQQLAVASSSGRSDGAALNNIHKDMTDIRERVSSLEAKIDTLIAGSFPHRMPGPP